MSGRPYAATITVRCTVAGCECEHSEDVRLYETKDNGQLIERRADKQCHQCGHLTRGHDTVQVEKRQPVERRTAPRDPSKETP